MFRPIRTLTFLFLFLSLQASAADFLDGFYVKMNRAFDSSKKCEDVPENKSYIAEKTAKTCPETDPSAKNRFALGAVSETFFYNRLAELDKDRLKCSREQWNSVSTSPIFDRTGRQLTRPAINAENQQLKIDQLNEVLPVLQQIRDKLNELGRAYAPNNQSNTSLATLQMMRKYANTAEKRAELDEKIKLRQLSNKDLEIEIEHFQSLYQQKLSEISNSDNPVVHKFIESRLSDVKEGNWKSVNVMDFQKLTADVIKSFDASIKETDDSKQNENYNLSIENRARLANDPTLLGQIIKENPEYLQHVEKYKCYANSVLDTKDKIETGVGAASMVVGGASFGLAKLARSTFALRAPRVGAFAEKYAKILGFATVGMDGVEKGMGFFKACTQDSKMKIKEGECALNPKMIQEEHAMSSCLWEGTLGSISAATTAAKFTAGLQAYNIKNSPMGRFIEEIRGKNYRGKFYEFAGSLNKEQRIAAAEGVLGRKLSDVEKQYVMDAHNMFPTKGLVATDSMQAYSKEEIAAKRQFLLDQKDANGNPLFSKREVEILSISGITGNNEVAALENTVAISKNVLGKPITDAQAKLIMQMPTGPRTPEQEKILLETLKSKGGFSDEQAKAIIGADFQAHLSVATGAISKGAAGTEALKDAGVELIGRRFTTGQANVIRALPGDGATYDVKVKTLMERGGFTEAEAKIILGDKSLGSKVAATTEAQEAAAKQAAVVKTPVDSKPFAPPPPPPTPQPVQIKIPEPEAQKSLAIKAGTAQGAASGNPQGLLLDSERERFFDEISTSYDSRYSAYKKSGNMSTVREIRGEALQFQLQKSIDQIKSLQADVNNPALKIDQRQAAAQALANEKAKCRGYNVIRTQIGFNGAWGEAFNKIVENGGCN